MALWATACSAKSWEGSQGLASIARMAVLWQGAAVKPSWGYPSSVRLMRSMVCLALAVMVMYGVLGQELFRSVKSWIGS